MLNVTNPVKQPRGTYRKISPENQATIAQYASEHGNKAAACYFSRKLDTDIKESSVSTWKLKYLKEIKRKVKCREAVVVKELPVKKRGRPLLLGEKLDQKVKSYIKAVR